MVKALLKAAGWRPAAIVLLTVSVLAGLFFRQPLAVSSRPFACRVIGISDGDTFACLKEGEDKIFIRLSGIDAPERRQPYGKKAKQYLSGQIHGKTVSVVSHGQDRYGRALGTVFLGRANINLKMVRSGYAWVYREYTDDAGLIGAEEAAKSVKAGLWADPHPINPADYRKQF